VIQATVGFIVYGVHKDGLRDPMGSPFIDEALIIEAKTELRKAGLQLVEHDTVIASKQEATEALKKMKRDDRVDAVVLFSGTWVWAAHIVGAVRDFASSGKGIVLWTHPRSQGWRAVGGLVLHGGLLEIGVAHRFVYGAIEEPDTVGRIVSYTRAAHLKNVLNMSTVGAFGGRGMGQTCGVADPSQWMRMFGVDIDSRDTTEIIRTAERISEEQLQALQPRLQELFGAAPAANRVNERSTRLYLAIKEIVDREDYLFYTIQSFPGLADDYAATCFAQSMMLEDGYGASTLSDFNTALTVFLLMSLSRERIYYGDLQHIDRKTKEIKIIGDGACPPSLAGKLGPAGFAEHGIPTEGGAGGLSVRLICKSGEGVLARLGRVNGEFQMMITRASIFEPSPEQVQQRLNESGIPFWPHGFVTAHCDIDALLQHWTNEYACLGYGEELYPALADFCEVTGIKPILL
jgi:L-fucose isomerase-like protein